MFSRNFYGYGSNFKNVSHGSGWVRLCFGHGELSYTWDQVRYNKLDVEFLALIVAFLNIQTCFHGLGPIFVKVRHGSG